jgi:hypothetical protein
MRIPINEFLSMISTDTDWSHLANKEQTNKIIELFDKVYGYFKGLSRQEE